MADDKYVEELKKIHTQIKVLTASHEAALAQLASLRTNCRRIGIQAQQALYVGKSLNPEGAIMFLNYREDGITPYFTAFKYGLKETKVASVCTT
ncbi:tRNA 2'-phosphotransferase [Mortierella polycephala]|uniref:Translationally-controlled tumor protein homolog n=1 Tax=Mortierella polycephala TaxID=41804 RepID=A0A9P6Q5N1_9FUNG|nr:tRNA 2'-phosphotransferase [Mortierella polycephala]